MDKNHAPLINNDDHVKTPRRVLQRKRLKEPFDRLPYPTEESNSERLLRQVLLGIELLQKKLKKCKKNTLNR